MIAPILFVFGSPEPFSIEKLKELPEEIKEVSEELSGELKELPEQALKLPKKITMRISKRMQERGIKVKGVRIKPLSFEKENNPNLNLQCRKTSRSPKNNKKLWFLMNKRKKDIAEKIAVYAKTSNRKIMKDFPYYKMILRNNPIPELSEEEIDYLNS